MKTKKSIKETQHVQVPTKFKDNNNELNIGEYYLYGWLKYFDGKNGCFPSQKTLHEKTNLSIPTIKSLSDSLVNKGFITITKKGRSNYYTFLDYNKFQRYSMMFMENNILNVNEKMFLMYMQQYMYLDNENHMGKISFTIDTMSKITKMKSTWLYNTLSSLAAKGIVTKLYNKSKDKITGCNTITYIFDLEEIGQNLLFKQVVKNTKDIEEMKEKYDREIADLKKLVKSLIKDKLSSSQNTIIV